MELIKFVELGAKELDSVQFEKIIETLRYGKVEMPDESIKDLLGPHKIFAPEKKDGEFIPRVEHFHQAEEWWKKSIPGTYEEFHLAVKIKNLPHESRIENIAQMARTAEYSGGRDSLIIFIHIVADLIKSGHV